MMLKAQVCLSNRTVAGFHKIEKVGGKVTYWAIVCHLSQEHQSVLMRLRVVCGMDASDQ